MALEYLPYIYAAACIGVICFQLALIAGAPWGRATQGGQHAGVLPTRNRIIAAVSIIIVAGKALAISSAAGLWPVWPFWTAWIALAIQAVVTVLNWITPSRAERRVWAPITSLMLILASTVVFSA